MMGTATAAEIRRILERLDHVARSRPPSETLRMALEKALVYVSIPLVRVEYRRKTFHYRGKSFPYFISQYNATWRNERMVEIPVALDFLRNRPSGPGLEVGNVLSHYVDTHHPVVDLHEQHPLVTNTDVLAYSPATPLDWILVISTLEHIGWDEDPNAPGAAPPADTRKIKAVVEHLRAHLSFDGRMLVTCPLGYNPILDLLVQDGSLLPADQTFLVRSGRATWRQVSSADRADSSPPYDHRRRAASVLWIAEFTSSK